MKKTTKNLLIGGGIAAAAAAAATAIAYHRTASSLVKLALDREPKENKRTKKTSNKVTGEPAKDEAAAARVNEAIESLVQQDIKRVEMESYDGEIMAGHWYPCENAKRVIIAMHGWRSSWLKDFAVIAEFWHKNGCSVLFAEQRGQGESGGEYMGFGLSERYDCREWVNWVNEKTGAALPIYLCGVSMGAATVLMSASLDMPGNVCGIMADCGFTSPHEIWKHVSENNLHLSYGVIGKIADDICRKKINMGTSDYSTVKAMTENKIPVLFIHGTADKFVPIEMTYENYAACTAPKHLLVVTGAAHGMSYFVAQEQYEKAVLEFWRSFDGPGRDKESE